jgi:hypothetical protein
MTIPLTSNGQVTVRSSPRQGTPGHASEYADAEATNALRNSPTTGLTRNAAEIVVVIQKQSIDNPARIAGLVTKPPFDVICRPLGE